MTCLDFSSEFIHGTLAVSKFFKMQHFSHDFLGKAVVLLKDKKYRKRLLLKPIFAGKRTTEYSFNEVLNNSLVLEGIITKTGVKKKQKINYVL